jgi:enoyl-CoA hydratase/carnithine racemase
LLAAATWRLCQQIAAMPPGAVQSARGLLLTDAARQRLHEAIDREWAVFAERLRSPEHKAAVKAFFSKRK